MKERPKSFFFQSLNFGFRYLRELFIIISLIWFRFTGKNPIYISLLISLIFIGPLAFSLKLSIGQIFLAYFSIALSLSSVLLINISSYEQILLIFLHYDIANSMFSHSTFSILLFFSEIWYIFSVNWTKFEFLMLAFNFLSACTMRLSLDRDTQKPFTFENSFLIAFISVLLKSTVNPKFFFFSLAASIPRRGFPCPPQKLTFSNWKSLFYVFLSVSTNGYILYYSTMNGALTLASDALTSMSSNIAILGAITTDVASRMLGTRTFTYGFSSSMVICDFASAILQIIAATKVIFESIENLIIGISDDGEEGDSNLIILAVVSLAVNIFGALFMDNFESNDAEPSCSLDGGALTIVCELISSAAVVFSSFLMSVFNMKFIDPYMSLLIGFLIYIVSMPSIMKTISILGLKSPFTPDYSQLEEATNAKITGNAFSVSDSYNAMYVKVVGSRVKLNRVIRKFARKHSVHFLAIENVM